MAPILESRLNYKISQSVPLRPSRLVLRVPLITERDTFTGDNKGLSSTDFGIEVKLENFPISATEALSAPVEGSTDYRKSLFS